jgi:hypothetical protein
MADPRGTSSSAAIDNTGVQAKNAINVAIEDVTEDDRKEVELELEDEVAEPRKKKLVCFQKTRNSVIKKADTTTTLGVKVNSYLSPEDLAHMVDISVASKYGDHLT